MFGTTLTPQAVGKYLQPAKSLVFETNVIQCKIMKFKYIFSILRDILINCVSPFYVHAEGRDIKSERKTVKILICDAPFLTL